MFIHSLRFQQQNRSRQSSPPHIFRNDGRSDILFGRNPYIFIIRFNRDSFNVCTSQDQKRSKPSLPSEQDIGVKSVSNHDRSCRIIRRPIPLLEGDCESMSKLTSLSRIPKPTLKGFPAQIVSLPVAENRAAVIAPAPGSVDRCIVECVLTAMKWQFGNVLRVRICSRSQGKKRVCEHGTLGEIP